LSLTTTTARYRCGGIRVIYYWDDGMESFYMLLAYAKNDQENLTSSQLRFLRRLVREEFE